jgi:hypothetical protein
MELIQKGRCEDAYATLPNDLLQDATISWQARGLLVFLLSLPSDWIINKTYLHKFSEKNGRDATITAFEELVEAGYIKKDPILGSKRGLCHYYVKKSKL